MGRAAAPQFWSLSHRRPADNVSVSANGNAVPGIQKQKAQPDGWAFRVLIRNILEAEIQGSPHDVDGEVGIRKNIRIRAQEFIFLGPKINMEIFGAK